MFKKAILLSFILFFPLMARAENPDVLTKFQKWQESFEKGDVDKVIENRDYFSFTEDELDYLFNSESQKAEKPFAVDFKITLNDNFLKFQASFKKVLKGKIYLEARPLDDKPGFQVLKAKYYGIRVPAKWIERILNREVDKYFNFLYQDSRFKGGKAEIKDKTARLLLEFE